MALTSYISNVLGKGHFVASIARSLVLLVILFFYIYTIASHFQLQIYPFEDRAISLNSFFLAYIVTEYLDHLIVTIATIVWLSLSSAEKKIKILTFLAYAVICIAGAILEIGRGATISINILLKITAVTAVPVIISLLIYQRTADKKGLNYDFGLLVNYSSLLGIALGIIGIIIILLPFFGISESSLLLPNYMYHIFLFFSIFSPLLLALLILCVPVKFLTHFALQRVFKAKKDRIHLHYASNITLTKKTAFMFLLFFTVLSSIIALIPHLPAINPDNQQIGVDTDYYIRWVTPLIDSTNIQEFLAQAFVEQPPRFGGDRPFTLIFLFAIATIVHDANLFYLFERLPVILAPALVLAVYFLTREISSKDDVAPLLASFITAVSFHTLIGIYAGFYANWLALIIGYSSFVFLFRFLRKPSKPNLLLYSTLLILTLLSHIHTWSTIVTVMAIFLIVMLSLNYYHRKRIIILLLIVISSIIIDVGRATLLGTSTGIELNIEQAQQRAGLSQFVNRWENLAHTVQIFVGGQLNNFIIFVLGLYWLSYSNLREVATIFLMIFLSLGVIPFLFSDYTIQNRVFYDIPFQIPASIALSYIIKKQPNGLIILMPICIWLAALSARSVANFYQI
jgi:hypothetical protein